MTKIKKDIDQPKFATYRKVEKDFLIQKFEMFGISNTNISDEMFESTAHYFESIIKWNKLTSLIGKSTEDDFWNRHVLDSLQLLKFIPDKNIHIVDLGSGAGIPGFILSIFGIKNVTLIESNSKKCAFLFSIRNLSNNNVEILNQRLTKYTKLKCDLVVCRAFASIEIILTNTSNFICDNYLLLKGKNYHNELEIAQKKWQFDYKLHNSISDIYGKIIQISSVRNI